MARGSGVYQRICSSSSAMGKIPWAYAATSSSGSIIGASVALPAHEGIALVAEEHVEGGERSVALGDVPLHVDLLGVGQLGVAVDLLLQYPEPVADADHLVEEGVERDLLGLQLGITGLEHRRA